jgi:2-polyprenyl-6-methoxyphenol hydroxylase-like FAD-dependent oxidoreductase
VEKAGAEPAMSQREDVFVIGGGPAGLAAALALRQKGFGVTVADAARPPIEKVCGEGILPEGVSALRQLGVTFNSDERFPLRGMSFLYASGSVQAEFPGAHGLGMRRVTLHKKLIQAAESAGIHLVWQSRVTGLVKNGVRLQGEVRRASWIVGADGSGSRVRRWAGLDSGRLRQARFAFRRHYRCAPWSDFVEVHWGPRCQFYVTPVGGMEVCVVIISRNPALRMDEAIGEFPSLTARLERSEILDTERGAVTGSMRHRRVIGGNVALVGDAASMVDAITGDGLRLAVRQAFALADALAANNPGQYQATHRRLMRRPAMMARLLTMLDGHPRLQRRVFRILSGEPEIFRRLLSVHAGQASPREVAAAGVRLSLRLLTAGN